MLRITKTNWGTKFFLICMAPSFVSHLLEGNPTQEADLLQVSKITPQIKIDLIWATGNNPLGLVLYPEGAECYLHRQAAYALNAVQTELEEMGYGLKILEAFRPLWAQQKLWSFIGYTPSDQNQGRHTLGLSVDVTIIDVKSGQEIAMPPYVYDDTPANQAIPLTQEQKSNSDLLRNLMIKNGFFPMDEEWFHFDYANWQNYMAINKNFSELESLQ